ncbi:hypothetical protein G3I59_38005 [Amycolatopsis rubida]|uniref:Uncharacterized protein n=1 Tax=Amycolatopsis rubida TaxID=112413 RepID=A0ABX0C3R4_9PSEU|nr:MULTISPECIES: hypothetical protein [Amycolatopsis]MYW96253.1 hypothetical protein [Amycolatopsis rubida]NEC61244.1 hypothetical protein [Amycolatopsis rubida]
MADLDRSRAKAIEAADAERRALKAVLDEETGELRAVMGESVRAVREVGTGMPETAALLGVSVGEARRLAAAARRLNPQASSAGSVADSTVHETSAAESATARVPEAETVTAAEQQGPDAVLEGERHRQWGGGSA